MNTIFRKSKKVQKILKKVLTFGDTGAIMFKRSRERPENQKKLEKVLDKAKRLSYNKRVAAEKSGDSEYLEN